MPIPTDRELDEMRRVGDPLVDRLVETRLSSSVAAGSLLRELFSSVDLPDHPLVAEYMAVLPPVTLDDPERIELGQKVFDVFGPEVLLILGSCALPLAYAAGNGVQVVARARRLKEDPIRRLCDTAQMVINVMQPGGLAEREIGWLATRKTRLIHALIRFHTRTVPNALWPEEFGLPINQEDLLGTLLAFSIAVLQGLRKIGAPIGAEQGGAYLHAWAQIGLMLGLDARLLPTTEAYALELALRIGQRQIRATPEGKELSDHLLSAVNSVFKIPGYAESLSRFLLEGSPFGENVAQVLQIPAPLFASWLVKARAGEKRIELRLLELIPGAQERRAHLVGPFVQQLLIWKQQSGAQVPFAVPPRLQLKWGVELQAPAPLIDPS